MNKNYRNEPQNQISPIDIFDRGYRSIGWLFAALLIGAGIGYLIHLVKPPIYEARVTFSIAIDQTRTGSLDDQKEDLAILSVQPVLYNIDLADRVSTELSQYQVNLSSTELLSMVRMERFGTGWQLKVWSNHPQTSALIANLWAEEAQNRFEEAYQHSLQAASLDRFLSSIETCLESAAFDPSAPVCGYKSMPELENQIQRIGSELSNEQKLSEGVFPALLFNLQQRAEVPEHPIRFDTGSLILAGAAIGFIVGMISIESGWIGKNNNRRKR